MLTDEDFSWTDEGTVYTEPEWILGGVNNPISHTKGLPLQVTATLDVRPTDLPSRSYTLDGDGALTRFDFYTQGAIAGGLDQTIALTPRASLRDVVRTIEDVDIEWSIQWSAQPLFCDLETTGPHKIYVTYGTPAGSTPTERRIGWVCEKADGDSTEGGVVDAIHYWLEADPPYNGNAGTIVDDWRL